MVSDNSERKPLLDDDIPEKTTSWAYGSTTPQAYTKAKKSKKKEKNKSVPFYSIFRYSSAKDIFLMTVGTLFAVIHGAGWPMLAIIFGQMTNTFLQQASGGFQEEDLDVSNSTELPINTTDLNEVLFSTVSTFATVVKRSLFDGIDPAEFESYMNVYALYYTYIGVCVFVASFVQVICWVLACERQIYKLRQEFFYEVLRKEIGWFDRHKHGELTMKLNDDLERIREGIGDKFSMVIQYLSTFVSGFVVGFFVGWQLTLVIMSLTPLMALSSAYIGKLVATSTAREQRKYAVAGSIAEEVLSCIRTVAAFCGQRREMKRYNDALTEGMRVAIHKYTMMAFGFGSTFIVLYGTYALAFWYGSRLVADNKMDPGGVFTVFFSVMIGSFSLGNAIPYITSVATAQGSANTIFKIIDNIPRVDPYSSKGIQPSEVKANIKFKNVTFSYPTRKSVVVLKNFSLDVKEGQTVALCGPSGSGKSTVISLLLRFYDAMNGKIELDSYPLNKLNVRWLRTIIGVVSQEPVLFGCTIAENIVYGRSGVTFQEVTEAAKMAYAHDFIMTLPEGYDTLVGDRGAQLSGGQKQRIAIARALVRNPKILLLDEATSALDAESEAIVQQALDKAREGRTTIIVAHRLSTIKDADVIYVFDKGQIMESGVHSELMDLEGLYYQLVTNQTFIDTEDVTSSIEEVTNSLAREIESSNKKSSLRGLSRLQSMDPEVRHYNRLLSEFEQEQVELPSGFQICRAAAPEWKEITLACFSSILTGAVLPVFAIFYSEIFATFMLTGEELKTTTFFWSMMFLVLAVVTALGNFLRTIGFGYSGERLTKRLREQAFKNILRQHIGWFDDEMHSTGKIATRLATDVPMVKTAAGHRLGSVVSAVMTLAASIIIAFIFGWKLAMALLVVVPLLLISGAMETKIRKGNQKRDAELMAEATNVVSESLDNIRTVQGLTQEPIFFQKFINLLLLPYMEGKKNARIFAFTFSFSQGIVFCIYAAAFRFGGYLISHGDMDATSVYRVFFAMAFSAIAVGQWMSYLPDYAKAKLSAGLIFQMIKMEPKIDNYSEGGIRPTIRGEITFQDVHFSYPSRKTAPILRGLKVNIKPGQTVALVGASGCGKSTLISLIERFYDPSLGQVKIDDFDIRTLNLSHLRKHIAVVSQEPVLFACSIRENIMYGVEDEVNEADIIKAAKLANIHDFIRTLPMGYETQVGERGVQLSGGQKQRIAIARALVRNPRILLLDEATSALDTESEKLVQQALDEARKGRTCVVVAHRLSTIQSADQIAVIEKGAVAEKGTHNELLELKGVYYRLTRRQRIKH